MFNYTQRLIKYTGVNVTTFVNVDLKEQEREVFSLLDKLGLFCDLTSAGMVVLPPLASGLVKTKDSPVERLGCGLMFVAENIWLL